MAKRHRPASPSEWVAWAVDELIDSAISIGLGIIVLAFIASCVWGVIGSG